MLSTRTLKSLALALAVAALAVPTTQARLTQAGKYGPLDPAIAAAIRNHQNAQSVPLITEHGPGRNGTGQASAAGKYGPLDPAIAAAIRNHQNAQSVPLITEHGPGRNGTGQASAAGKYGPLDPAIATAIRNHSHDQNGVSRSAAASAPAAAPHGFDWTAAGLGPTVAFAAMLLGFAVARLIPRRSRTRLAA